MAGPDCADCSALTQNSQLRSRLGSRHTRKNWNTTDCTRIWGPTDLPIKSNLAVDPHCYVDSYLYVRLGGHSRQGR
jgi:hypothetical protein